MSLTPLQIKSLELLNAKGHNGCHQTEWGFSVMKAQSRLTNQPTPRQENGECDYAPQAMALWAGGYVKPLVNAGLVRKARRETATYLVITQKGREALQQAL